MNHDIKAWQPQIESLLKETMEFDVAHDIAHIYRVTQTALRLGQQAEANLHIIYPACMLHDCVNVPKKSPLRKQGSKLSADKAVQLLQTIDYPNHLLEEIHHAIVAHSYSANIEPTTLEAKIVQDADRLDALGAIGLSRCFMLGGKWDSQLYHPTEPLATSRELDDKLYCLDHVFVKLKNLPATMQTTFGRIEADKRWSFIESYVEQLQSEM